MLFSSDISMLRRGRILDRSSLPRVGRVSAMKGKGKSKARDRDIWGFESDEEIMFGRSPKSLPNSLYIEEIHVMASHMKEVRPRNAAQEQYIKLLEGQHPSIVVAVGPAGVAKTFLCNAIGIQKLLNGEVEKLVITRPAVSVDEQHGFLPGTLEEKMDPWLRPIYDVFYKFITPQKVQMLIAKQQIEICPLAYMRGRTFDNAWICADEMQNSTPQQMLMLLTRIGKNSKLVITGDPAQHDRGFHHNGLQDLMHKLHHSQKEENDIKIIEFTEEHVERHPVIKRILKMYNAKTVPSD